MLLRIFGVSASVAVVGLVASALWGGWAGLLVAAALAILEVSISFDNAVVNATILQRMNPFWQRLFLTVGILIAVFGMRLVFPLLIVGVTAGLGPIEAVRLALERGDPDQPGSYGYLLHQAHPMIAAFGGLFLLMLFLDFLFTERDVRWLQPVERVVARLGRFGHLPVVLSLAVIALTGQLLAPDGRERAVLVSGVLGLGAYLLVNGLGNYFESRIEKSARPSGPSQAALAAGKAGFFLFCYLEVIDASFSFDGVVGAFAVTTDPVLIAIGLGIGAFFIRSITIYLVRSGSLTRYPYLEHGAMWAIGSLATILVVSIAVAVPEWLTAGIGLAILAAAMWSSIRRRPSDEPEMAAGAGPVSVPAGAGSG